MKLTDKRIKFIAGAAVIAVATYWGYDQWREHGAADNQQCQTEVPQQA